MRKIASTGSGCMGKLSTLMNLTELCSWDKNVFEPVFTCQLTLQEIKQFKEQPMVVPYRPVHGQSMERAVKQVTRACESVYGEEARDGFIRAGVANRQVMKLRSTLSGLWDSRC